MNEITEEEFYNFLYTQNIITDLIEEKTKELSIILYNRLPIGKMCDVDICESEFEVDCIFVEFDLYQCGESCMDQYNLPIRFLYDEDYPAIYKKEREEEEKLKKREEIFRKKKIKEDIHKEEENKRLSFEKYEKSEYERLKTKYE